MSGYAAAGEPGTGSIAGMSKIVSSSTLKEPLGWANTVLIAGEAVATAREMKAKGDQSRREKSAIEGNAAVRAHRLVGLATVFPAITGRAGMQLPVIGRFLTIGHDAAEFWPLARGCNQTIPL